MFGFLGYLAATGLVTGLAHALALAASARPLLALVPPVTLLLAIKLSQLAYGYERIVFYEQAIAVVATTVAAVAVSGGPVARAFDLATLGMGLGLAVGRIGCFRVACCYGRRGRIGVRYGAQHAAVGFPARWVGLPIVPLQLLDAGASLAATALGSRCCSATRHPALEAASTSSPTASRGSGSSSSAATRCVRPRSA